MSSTLERHASEVRALSLALEVRCPNPLHPEAFADTPCYPPSEEHPSGWVCIDRIAREVDTRAERAAEQRRKALGHDGREARRRRAERASYRSRDNALRAAAIAAASHDTQTTKG